MSGRVEPDREVPGAFLVRSGSTQQSWVDPDDPLRLEFEYVQRIADALRATILRRDRRQRLRAVHIGGGGLTLPRWLAAVRPGTSQLVFEPDADLLAQVRRMLPIARDLGIAVRNVDGRTGLADLPDAAADLVVVDAFDGLRVPGSLATAEAFADIARVLERDGLLVMNLADERPFDWARRCVAGLAGCFRHVSPSAEPAVWKGRRYGNLVVLASGAALPVADLDRADRLAVFGYRRLDPGALRRWLGGARPFDDADAQDSPGPRTGRTWFE